MAEWLTPRLKKARLRLCVDDESFDPGALSIVEMERGVVESRKTVLFLTPAYVKSEWTTFEHSLAQTLDPAALDSRVVPVLLAKCDRPLRLKALVYIDFTTPKRRSDNLSRLIRALSGEKGGGGGDGDGDETDVLNSKDRDQFRKYLVERHQYLDFRGMGVSDRVPPRLPLIDRNGRRRVDGRPRAGGRKGAAAARRPRWITYCSRTSAPRRGSRAPGPIDPSVF